MICVVLLVATFTLIRCPEVGRRIGLSALVLAIAGFIVGLTFTARGGQGQVSTPAREPQLATSMASPPGHLGRGIRDSSVGNESEGRRLDPQRGLPQLRVQREQRRAGDDRGRERHRFREPQRWMLGA
jgi:hypothetical protein